MQFYKLHANSSPLLDFNLLSASSSNFDLFYVSYKTYSFNIFCFICLGVVYYFDKVVGPCAEKEKPFLHISTHTRTEK